MIDVHKVVREGLERIERELSEYHEAFESRKVLVAGGAGFIGTWVCRTLLRLGAEVVCVDNFASSLPENVEELLSQQGFTLLKKDVSKPLAAEEVGRVNIVLHLASRAAPPEFDSFPVETLLANTVGTANLLELSRACDATFLFASSSEVYGDPPPNYVPTPEIYTGNVNPVGPRSCYEEAKRCGEAFAKAYEKQYGLDVRIVRIFNTYGPYMRAEGIYGRVVSRFITQALANQPITIYGDGSQSRSFTYVTDLVNGLLRATCCDKARGEVINIGSEREIKIIELAHLIKKLTRSSSEFKFEQPPPDDPRRRCPDISKAKKLLNWTPKVGLEEGLTYTIEWFRDKMS